MRKTSSTAQPRQGRERTATSIRTTALTSTERAAQPIRAGCAASVGWRRQLCARHCCAWAYPTPNTMILVYQNVFCLRQSKI
jgi:hypothetical protein